MLDLVINRYATLNTSRGVKRYYSEIEKRIRKDLNIEYYDGLNFLGRFHELTYFGKKDCIFWSPTHRASIFARNQIVTVHDLINIESAYKNDWRRSAYEFLASKFYKNSITIVAISETTRKNFLNIFNIDEKKVIVIKSGLYKGSLTRVEDLCKLPFELTSVRYVLFVTNILPHKNNEMALRAICKSLVLKEKIKLVIVGSISSDSISYLNSTKLQYIIMDFVSDDFFNSLLNFAYFVFSPSLMEGHNLTIAQAMNYLTPVLCSNIEVHKEFYNNYPFYFDPSKEESIVECIDSFVNLNIYKMSDFSSVEVERTFDDVAKDYKFLFQSIK